MRSQLARPACLLLSAALLGGCGSATKTVTVSSAPVVRASTTTGAHTRTSASTSTTATSTTAATRTAGEPAFTHGARSPDAEASAAAATVRARGYTPNDVSEYHGGQTLRVLTATRTGSGDGYAQQAFFFVGRRYIGTDSSQPSAGVKVVAQSDTEVTLRYPLYATRDALCCPSGGHADVRFQLDNGRLTPLQNIPPASSRTGLSRQ
jgi:hypothetical protein